MYSENPAQPRMAGRCSWYLPLPSYGLTDKRITRGTRTGTGWDGLMWQVCVTGPEPRVPRQRCSSFDHAPFLFRAETCLCIPKAETRRSWRGSRHPQTVSPLCHQPVPTLWEPHRGLGDRLVWRGTRENQDMQRRHELLLCGSVGEQLKIAHSHTSPLTAHPAPKRAWLLSPEQQLGHTRSPHTLGWCAPALLL